MKTIFFRKLFSITLLVFLTFSSFFFINSQQVLAHKIPEKVIEFLLDNPQPTEIQIKKFIEKNPNLEGLMPFGYNKSSSDTTANKVIPSPPLNNFWVNAGTFIVLGIEHILSGSDHILFVISLVLIAISWRKIGVLVSTFTVAHSLTLIFSGSGLFEISAKIVEPIIALSIIYTTLTSVFLAKYYKFFREFKYKVWIVFVFGLFHGLGFAGLLGDFDIPQEKFLSSLLFFNGGVEIGQIIILLLTLPILWLLRKSKYGKSIIQIFAIFIIGISSFWFFERVFL